MDRLVVDSPILGPALRAPYFSEEASAGESCPFSSLSSYSSMQGLGGLLSHCGHPWPCAPSHPSPPAPNAHMLQGNPQHHIPTRSWAGLEEKQALPNNHNECSRLILDTWAGGSQRQVISAKGGNHAPLGGFFCTNGWGKRNLCFFLKPSSPSPRAAIPHSGVFHFLHRAQCSSPVPQPAAQPSFSSNRFFSSKAKAEQNWFFCKLTQLRKKSKEADKHL